MPVNDIVFQRLRLAQSDDLDDICKVLGIKKKIIQKEDLIAEISKEFRSVAGHSLMNLFRGMHDLTYKEILIDALNEIVPGWFTKSHYKKDDHHTEITIENEFMSIIQKKVQDNLNKLPADEKNKLLKDAEKKVIKEQTNKVVGMFASSTASVIIGSHFAEYVALQIFGESLLSSLSFGLIATELSTTSVLVGGAAVAAPLLIASIAYKTMSPSYNKTIFICLKLISIRKRSEMMQELDI